MSQPSLNETPLKYFQKYEKYKSVILRRSRNILKSRFPSARYFKVLNYQYIIILLHAFNNWNCSIPNIYFNTSLFLWFWVPQFFTPHLFISLFLHVLFISVPVFSSFWIIFLKQATGIFHFWWFSTMQLELCWFPKFRMSLGNMSYDMSDMGLPNVFMTFGEPTIWRHRQIRNRNWGLAPNVWYSESLQSYRTCICAGCVSK